MGTVLYLIVGLVAATYQRRFVAALAKQDQTIPDLTAALDAMLDRPGRIFQTSMSIGFKYIRALFRRLDDDELEGLRLTAVVWWAITLAVFIFVIVL